MNTIKNHTTQNTNQAGFGVVGIVLIIVTLLAIGGAGYYVLIDDGQDGDGATHTTDNLSTARFDNAVRNHLSQIMVELNNYAANNNGRFPSDAAEFDGFENYLSTLDPHPVSELPYTINPDKSETHEVVSYGFGQCGEDGFMQSQETTRRVAISKQLPGGETYCVDNS